MLCSKSLTQFIQFFHFDLWLYAWFRFIIEKKHRTLLSNVMNSLDHGQLFTISHFVTINFYLNHLNEVTSKLSPNSNPKPHQHNSVCCMYFNHFFYIYIFQIIGFYMYIVIYAVCNCTSSAESHTIF